MVTPINEIWIGEDNVRRKLEGKELEAFLAQREIDEEAARVAKALEEATKAELAALKQSVLDRLGITEDEAKALLA